MLWITIDREKPVSLIRQVYTEIRTRILHGQMTAGYKLPSTRSLSEELHISRNVVVEAYEQLLAEGYLESRQGSGYFVASGIYLEQHARSVALSSPLVDKRDDEPRPALIDFRSGIPALELFPRKTWGKIVQHVCLEASASVFGYGRPEGQQELREVLCRYLYRMRGVQCEPEQIVMTSGATQALSLIAKVLLEPGSTVQIEDPITHDIQTIFRSSGAVLQPVPADAYGMVTDALPDAGSPSPRFVFVTPSHQFPLGGTLPIQRRISLIHHARRSDCYIVEDDYDSEFRYESAPISSIQGLAPERVIYIGSFSKILSPSLRLGYLVLPQALVKQYREAKWFTDLHTSTLDQLALSRFIEEGHLEKYISRAKKQYKKRRQCLTDALRQAFGEKVCIWGESAGLHIVAAFPGIHFTSDMFGALKDAGVLLYPVEEHAIARGRHEEKLIMGYGNVTEEQIVEGVSRMKAILVQVCSLS